MTQTNEEKLLVELSSLREELQNLVLKREELRSALRNVQEELNAVRDELRKKRFELADAKMKLASLREEIAKVKNDIKSLKEKFTNALNNFKQASSELRALARASSYNTIDELRQKIEELEWNLITTPNISIEREKQIVGEISRLEQKMKALISQQLKYTNVVENYEKSRREVNELRELISKKKEYLNELIKQLIALKESRDKVKNEIVTLIDNIKKLKNKRDEIKTQLTSISNIIKEKKLHYQEILRELRRLKEESKRREQYKVLKEKKERVMKKMSQGERLTIYDLYIAYSSENSDKNTS